MYDPVKRAEEVAAIVSRGVLRKYYRFRPARFYGGIATADCVGCSLRCIFCWSWREVIRPDLYGRFYSPEEVAGKLTAIAREKGFLKVRISGNEPTISRGHLLNVLERIPGDILFILETNGILIGHDETYALDLARFENLYVRLSLKGTTEEEFSRLTGAEAVGFVLQLRALDYLYQAGVRVQPAVMVSFSPPENVRAFRQRLGQIAPALADIEIEELVLYGDVKERLRKAGLRYGIAYEPRYIPPEQV
ncbi:MAG: radical SAM protein [Thermodesulfobacteriota bacterium]